MSQRVDDGRDDVDVQRQDGEDGEPGLGQRELDDQEHRGHRQEELAEVPAGVDRVADEPAHRSAVLGRHVALVAGLHRPVLDVPLRLGPLAAGLLGGRVPRGGACSPPRRPCASASGGPCPRPWAAACSPSVRESRAGGRCCVRTPRQGSRVACLSVTDAAPSSSILPGDRTDALRARTAAAFGALRADLEALVRIPSVSNAEFDQAHVAASADAVVALLRGAGLDDVQVLSVPSGAPAVVGRRPAPEGAPTVLLYAHHDVQPPGDDADWDSPPFEPTERGGRLYGRGAADDKAGVIAHVGALRVLGDELGVGVTVFIEGEEEIGSPTFTAFLHAYQDLLARGRHRRRRLLQLGDRGPGPDHVAARPGGLRGRGGRAGARRALGHVRRRGPRRAHPAGTPDHHAARRRGQRRRRRPGARAGPDRRLRRGHVPRRRERARRGPPGGHRTDHRPAVDPPRDRRHRLRRPPRGERVEHHHPARVGQALRPSRTRPGPGRRDGRAADAPGRATRPSALASP